MKKIGIVLVCWRELENSAHLLKIILAWKTISPVIYLVQTETKKDNFSEFQNENLIKLFSEENLGFSGSNNLGILKSIEDQNDCTLLINSDAFINETELLKIVTTLNSDNSIFSVGPVIKESFKNASNDYVGGNNIAENINTRIKLADIVRPKDSVLTVPYNIGAIVLFNNIHLQKVGLLDNEYFFSGEIADLCYRGHQLGLKSVTNLKAKGFHNTEDTPSRATLYKYYSLRNRFIFIRKNKLSSKYLIKWYKLLFKEMLHGIYIKDYAKTKTMVITFIDVVLRKTGNRNSKF